MTMRMRAALAPPCPKTGSSLGASVRVRLTNCPMLTRMGPRSGVMVCQEQESCPGVGHERRRQGQARAIAPAVRRAGFFDEKTHTMGARRRWAGRPVCETPELAHAEIQRPRSTRPPAKLMPAGWAWSSFKRAKPPSTLSSRGRPPTSPVRVLAR